MYIKYLDQRLITGKFQDTNQIKKTKPSFVEAVGYLVKEDSSGVYLASTINGEAFANILFIPNGAIVKKDYKNVKNCAEVTYVEAQGMNKQMTLEKLNSISKPPAVKLCGYLASEDDQDIYIAQEKNEDGKFRTITVVSKSLIVKDTQKKVNKHK